METEPQSPERKDREKLVVLYDEERNLYAPLEDSKGVVLLDISQVSQISSGRSLLKVGDGYFERVDPISAISQPLARKIEEVRFVRENKVNPNQAVIVRKIPKGRAESGQFDIYERKTPQEIREEKHRLARNIK